MQVPSERRERKSALKLHDKSLIAPLKRCTFRPKSCFSRPHRRGKKGDRKTAGDEKEIGNENAVAASIREIEKERAK